jgi:hypothetical protein
MAARVLDCLKRARRRVPFGSSLVPSMVAVQAADIRE